MTTAPQNQKTDHSGILISPVAGLLCSTILSGLVIYKAYELQTTGMIEDVHTTRASGQLIGELTEGLARTLGLVPSIGVAVVILAAMGAWFAITYKKYKALTAADERAAT